MASINGEFRKLAAGYLFPEIKRRVNEWKAAHPGVTVLSLGIGNTTEALPAAVVSAIKERAELLAHRETYTGYGDEQGELPLREALAAYYASWGVHLQADEFFVSDGAKADAANIQQLFDSRSVVAVQDPAYPVYVDSNVVAGRAGVYSPEKESYTDLVYLPCVEERGFIPVVPAGHVDLIYLCNPNNPTGAVATKTQLKDFVDYALGHKAVIIYDAAYSEYISDPALPRSIYEIPGAELCAIELNSFSKFSGFTGVRLGWTIVPRTLICADSKPGELHRMWFRRQSTFFNGASNLAQSAGLAALHGAGLTQSRALVAYYKENARIIRDGLQAVGLTVHGGTDSPYVWTRTPKGMGSWEFFDLLLDRCHVVVTPGAGFGPSGEGYVRVSSYGHREDVEAAMASIKKNLAKENLG